MEYSETDLFDELDNLRESGTATGRTKFIKKFSDNYAPELLESLLKDIDFYLFVEKDIKECEFSEFDIENAINRRIENGLEIPYYKNSKRTELTEKQKEIRNRLNSNAKGVPQIRILTPTINREELLFPFEFFIIYQLKNQILAKIKDLKDAQLQHYNSNNIEITFKFINNFDSVNEVDVYNYFKKELVEKKYLSIENLETYLRLSFEKKELPQTKFILQRNRTLKDIRVIFYNYYKNVAYKPNGKQSEYIKLLTDYFQGFEYDKVRNNFNS